MNTASASTPDPRTVPLRIQVATLLTVLLLFTGTLLGWLAYHNATSLLWSASERLSAQVSGTLQASLRATYGPVATAVNLLSRSAVTRTRDFEARWRTLPLLAESLADNPQLDAVHAAFENGDFLLMRPLRSEQQRRRLQAPPDAEFMAVHTFVGSDGNRRGEHVYFDADLIEIARRVIADDPFRPRTRNWYRNADPSNLRLGRATAVRTPLLLPASFVDAQACIKKPN